VVELIEAAAWRHAQKTRRAVMTAWLTEAYARQKELPSLDRVLADEQRAPDLTPDQEQSVWDSWAKQHNAAIERTAAS
jgi:hypothetical protein